VAASAARTTRSDEPIERVGGSISIAIGTALASCPSINYRVKIPSMTEICDHVAGTRVIRALFPFGADNGVRGARASKLCIFNFVIVVLSFTVVNLYLSHSHRYF